MQIKRYEVKSIQEALKKIKGDLGEEAVVLSTKRLPGSEGLLEIIAARDEAEVRPLPRMFAGNDEIGELKREVREIKFLLQSLSIGEFHSEISLFKEELNTLFDILGLRKREKGNDVLKRLYQHLVEVGISKGKALKLLEEVKQASRDEGFKNYEEGLATITSYLEEYFSTPERKEGRIQFFLGPAGVGKTTTLAKIAARYALSEGKRVGLITTDTYRIAAVEQIKVYARIMELPLEVATNRKDLLSIFSKYNSCDYILVDTPGRGPAALTYLRELKEEGGLEIDANLLLALNSSREFLMETAENYQVCTFNRLIVTKIDEVNKGGGILEIFEKTKKPIAYITTGQNVPTDIEEASPKRLASLVVYPRH